MSVSVAEPSCLIGATGSIGESGHRTWSSAIVTPRRVLCGLIALFTVTFAALGIRQHEAYGSAGFDLGIYDQTFWLVSRGETFMTMRGMSVWGHHINLVGLLFAPAYWLGAGPRFLLVTQALVLGLGAWPIWQLVRRRLDSAWAGVAGAAGYLLYAPIEWLTWTNFHPEALAITPLLWVWWFATERRWRGAWIAIALAVCTREEAGLVVAMLGVALFSRSRRTDAAERRGMRAHAALIAAFGAAWFLVSSQIIIPAFTGGAEPFYVTRYYGEWGSSMGEVLRNVVRRPGRVLQQIIDRRTFLVRLFAPTAVLGVFAPSLLLLCLPQALVVLLGNQWFLWDVRFQYTAFLVPGVIMATIEGVARTWQVASLRKPVAVAFLTATAIGHFLLAPSPIAAQSSQWLEYADPARVAAAVARIPAHAAVSASEHIVPHLTRRELVWVLPNPYIPVFYGPTGDAPADLAVANKPEWLLLETSVTGGGRILRLVSYLRSIGSHHVVTEGGGVLVLRKGRDLTAAELRQLRATISSGPDRNENLGARTVTYPLGL